MGSLHLILFPVSELFPVLRMESSSSRDLSYTVDKWGYKFLICSWLLMIVLKEIKRQLQSVGRVLSYAKS